LKLDSWETNDGQKRSKLRVVCERMQMLGGKSGAAAEGGARSGPRSQAASQYSQSAPPREEFEAPPQEMPPQEIPPPDDIPFEVRRSGVSA